MLQGWNSMVFSLNLNQPSVLLEGRPELNEFQTEGTEAEKAHDAKAEYSYYILDRVLELQ